MKTWKKIFAEERKLMMTQRPMAWRMKGIGKLQHIFNKDLRFHLRVKNVAEITYTRKYPWVRHVGRDVEQSMDCWMIYMGCKKKTRKTAVKMERSSACAPRRNHEDTLSAISRRMEEWLPPAQIDRNKSVELYLQKISRKVRMTSYIINHIDSFYL